MSISSIPVIGDIYNYFTSDSPAQAKSAGTASQPVSDPGVLDRIWAFFEGQGREIMVSTYTGPTVGLLACTSEGAEPPSLEMDPGAAGADPGGIPMLPPDRNNEGGEAGQASQGSGTEEGYVPPENPDVEVLLPLGNQGEPILPDDVWFGTDCGEPNECNTGSMFIEESAYIVLGSGPMIASGLQNIADLRIGCAVDSTLIGPIHNSPDIPDNENIPDMPANGCFPGMIDITMVDPDVDPIFGDLGCSEEGYSEFLACPSNENRRLPLYLAEWTLACRDLDGHDISLSSNASQEIFPTPDQIETNPEGEGIVNLAPYLFCAEEGPELFDINVPQECYHADFGGTGFADAEISLRLYLDNMQAVDSHVYQTYLRCRMYIGEE